MRTLFTFITHRDYKHCTLLVHAVHSQLNMNYAIWGHSELVRAIEALENELTKAFEAHGMTTSDAQGAVEAIIANAL